MPAPPLVPLRVQSDTQVYTRVGSNIPGGSNMRESNLNVNQKISIKTMADFKLRTEVKPIRRMDGGYYNLLLLVFTFSSAV